MATGFEVNCNFNINRDYCKIVKDLNCKFSDSHKRSMRERDAAIRKFMENFVTGIGEFNKIFGEHFQNNLPLMNKMNGVLDRLKEIFNIFIFEENQVYGSLCAETYDAFGGFNDVIQGFKKVAMEKLNPNDITMDEEYLRYMNKGKDFKAQVINLNKKGEGKFDCKIEELERKDLSQQDKSIIDNRIKEYVSENPSEFGPVCSKKGGTSKLVIHGKRNRRRRRKNVVKKLLLFENQVIEKYAVTADNETRVTALIGGHGLKAVKDIPRLTVIGRYFGDTWIASDIEIFAGSRLYHNINTYAFNKTVDVKLPLKDIRRYNSEQALNGMEIDGDGDDEKEELHCFDIVIDGYHNPSNLMYINDIRKDITSSATVEDVQFENVMFVCCYVDGFPHIFGVTIKDVKCGETLNVDYGVAYSNSFKEGCFQDRREIKMKNIFSELE